MQLYTDACVYGLGFFLTQHKTKIVDGEETTVRNLVNMGSTSLTKTQARYSPIELECFALQWSVSNNHFFLYEFPQIDHYTDSTGIIDLLKKDMSKIKNARIERILEKVPS